MNASKPTMMRLLARIERLEGIAIRAELHLVNGRQQKWYWLERALNTVERQHMQSNAEEMRLLTLYRDLATPFLPANLRKTLDGSRRRAPVLLAGREQYHERTESLVQPALPWLLHLIRP